MQFLFIQLPSSPLLRSQVNLLILSFHRHPPPPISPHVRYPLSELQCRTLPYSSHNIVTLPFPFIVVLSGCRRHKENHHRDLFWEVINCEIFHLWKFCVQSENNNQKKPQDEEKIQVLKKLSTLKHSFFT